MVDLIWIGVAAYHIPLNESEFQLFLHPIKIESVKFMDSSDSTQMNICTAGALLYILDRIKLLN